MEVGATMSKQNSQETRAEILGGEEFITELAAKIDSAGNEGRSVSIAVIDIDEFGRINEEYGTDSGDAVLAFTIEFLKRIAERGGATLHRAMFRCGGDEFAIILSGIEKEEAFLMTEHARAEFASNPFIRSGDETLEIPLTWSAAISTYPEDGARAQDVMRKAVDAIYRAKMTGRNKVCLAKEERMVTKTSHYTQPQLARLSQLSKRESIGEAVLLREALDDLLTKYDP
jgi:diguanylate cyclase (GGDEF)-like protein